MADHAFERRLQQLFAEAPALPDAAIFAARVESRLDRGWTVRSLAIGAAGLVGGSVAVVQLAGSDWIGRVELASRSSAAQAEKSVGGVVGGFVNVGAVLRSLPVGGETVWLIAGLAALAVALLATRALEEF